MRKLKNCGDELLAKNLVKYGDPVEAFLQTYSHTADKLRAAMFVQGKLKSSQFVQRVSELLDKQGGDICTLNKTLIDMLEADKYIATKHGIEPVPDNQSRIMAAERVYKLHGLLKEGNINIDHRQVDIRIDEDTLIRFSNAVKELKSLEAGRKRANTVQDNQQEPITTVQSDSLQSDGITTEEAVQSDGVTHTNTVPSNPIATEQPNNNEVIDITATEP